MSPSGASAMRRTVGFDPAPVQNGDRTADAPGRPGATGGIAAATRIWRATAARPMPAPISRPIPWHAVAPQPFGRPLRPFRDGEEQSVANACQRGPAAPIVRPSKTSRRRSTPRKPTMNEAIQTSCQCPACPGSACTCGCQQPASQQGCACGPECKCGAACACNQA